MLKQEIVCPYCSCALTALVWIDGTCPDCAASYYWSTEFAGDFSDGWYVVDWDRSASIYIASTLANWRRVRAILEFLKGRGVQTAFDWTPWGEEIFGSLEYRKPRDLNPDSLRSKACQEYKGLLTASYLLVVAPTGNGTNFELGNLYARSRTTGLPISILEEYPSMTPTSFHYLPGIKRFSQVRDVMLDILTHFRVQVKDISMSELYALEAIIPGEADA
jgi:hypothetical protein